MPRSFRFDHFQVPQSAGPRPRGPHPVPSADMPASASGLHYGHKFQETEILHHKLEERAAAAGHRPQAPKMSIPKLEPAKASADAAPGDPAEPWRNQPMDRWLRIVEEVWTEAKKPWTLIKHAASDLSEAGSILWHLPGDAARLIRQP